MVTIDFHRLYWCLINCCIMIRSLLIVLLVPWSLWCLISISSALWLVSYWCHIGFLLIYWCLMIYLLAIWFMSIRHQIDILLLHCWLLQYDLLILYAFLQYAWFHIASIALLPYDALDVVCPFWCFYGCFMVSWPYGCTCGGDEHNPPLITCVCSIFNRWGN